MTPKSIPNAEAQRLADEICDAINELAAGAQYPDLIEAVRRLAALSQEGGQAGASMSDEEVADAVSEIVGINPGAWDTIHSSQIVQAFRRVLAGQAGAVVPGRELDEDEVRPSFVRWHTQCGRKWKDDEFTALHRRR